MVDPWLDDRSPTERILTRPPLDALTGVAVRNFIGKSERAIRNKDMSHLMSLLAPEMRYSGPALINGSVERIVGDRAAFLMAMGANFEVSPCHAYRLRIESLDELKPTRAEVTLNVNDPCNPFLEELFGHTGAMEQVTVTLFQGRPALYEVEIAEPPNNPLQ